MLRELRTLPRRRSARAPSRRLASRIGLTQAAVSAQMQRLEGELGFDLFDRSGRTARLNERGRQTLDAGPGVDCRSTATWDRARSRVCRPRVVNIGAIASVQRSMLPDALAALPQAVASLPHARGPGRVEGLDRPGRCGRTRDGGDHPTAVLAAQRSALDHVGARAVSAARSAHRWRATTGPSCSRPSPSSATTAAPSADDRSTASCGLAHMSVQDVSELDELDAIVRLGGQWRRGRAGAPDCHQSKVARGCSSD